MKKFYITTAIDYVNSLPHGGHMYEKIIADVIARWKRIQGHDVYFVTGTDDNATKNEEAAKKAGMPTREFVNKNSKEFEKLCNIFNISNDFFIRTDSNYHRKVAQEIFKGLYDKGEIYKGTYSGLYCIGCEAFYTEKDLVDGKCPEHPNMKIETVEEESYFFKLSKYRNKLLKLTQSKGFIVPETWKHEIVSRLKNEELKDLSVSRINKKWGIPVPIDNRHIIQVWFEALLNYRTATRINGKEKYWPGDVHLIGKGINWFHSVIFQAILFAAGLELSRTILVHGYLTIDGKKISKSLGNAWNPVDLIKKYPVDAVRYYLMREFPLDKDGDFSESTLKERYNNELANDLGNLVSRTITMVEKYFRGKIPDGKNKMSFNFSEYTKYMDNYELHNAISEAWKLIRLVNKYINDSKPWEARDKENILYTALDCLRLISILVYPFIPESAEKIAKQIGCKIGTSKDLKFNLLKNGKVNKGEIIFKKVK